MDYYGVTLTDLYQFIILPTAVGVMWVVRKIYVLEARIRDAENSSATEAALLRSELKTVEATINGQINTTRAQHEALRDQLNTILRRTEMLLPANRREEL